MAISDTSTPRTLDKYDQSNLGDFKESTKAAYVSGHLKSVLLQKITKPAHLIFYP